VSALRKVVFGETWILPVGVAFLILSSKFILKPLLGTVWTDLGGVILLALVLLLFTVSLRRG
jgi:hypothetical protein